MPKIEAKRFYTSQWDDLWGFVLDNPGSVEDGNDGVSVLLASPTWKGELPKGVKRVIQGDSEFLGTLTRTQLFDPKDLPNVKKIQKEYKLVTGGVIVYKNRRFKNVRAKRGAAAGNGQRRAPLRTRSGPSCGNFSLR